MSIDLHAMVLKCPQWTQIRLVVRITVRSAGFNERVSGERRHGRRNGAAGLQRVRRFVPELVLVPVPQPCTIGTKPREMPHETTIRYGGRQLVMRRSGVQIPEAALGEIPCYQVEFPGIGVSLGAVIECSVAPELAPEGVGP